MKKRTLFAALLLLLALAVFPASAEFIEEEVVPVGDATSPADDPLALLGLSEEQMQALEAMLAQMEGEITPEQMQELITSFAEVGANTPLAGEVTDGVYMDPSGYSFAIPEGWTLLPNHVGLSVMLQGPLEDSGVFAPSISVMTLGEMEDDFLDKTQEEIDALLSASLENYQLTELNDFTFQDEPAREIVLMHGADEESMLVQYQLHFHNDGRAFIVTMTTLAEEAANDRALDTYEAFLSTFTIYTGEGGSNG